MIRYFLCVRDVGRKIFEQIVGLLLLLITKRPVLESLFKKVAGPRTCNFLKKKLQHSCFSSEFSKTCSKKVFVNLKKFTRGNKNPLK